MILSDWVDENMSSHAYITNVGYDNVTLDKKGWDDCDSDDWHSHRQTNGNSYDNNNDNGFMCANLQ